MRREDDFEERRKHIANLSDEELYKRFWELTDMVVDPLLELGNRAKRSLTCGHQHSFGDYKRNAFLGVAFRPRGNEVRICEDCVVCFGIAG